MTAAELLGGVGVGAVVGTLLTTGAGHVLRPATLRRALAAHGVLPGPAVVAVLVTLAECGLGAAGLAALVAEGDLARVLLRVSLVGGALLLAQYAGYGWYVSRRGGGPCGCSRTELPMTGWVATRALALAVLALVGATLADPGAPFGPPGTEQAITLLAAAVIGVLLWQLPPAMHDPAAGVARPRPGASRPAAGTPAVGAAR